MFEEPEGGRREIRPQIRPTGRPGGEAVPREAGGVREAAPRPDAASGAEAPQTGSMTDGTMHGEIQAIGEEVQGVRGEGLSGLSDARGGGSTT